RRRRAVVGRRQPGVRAASLAQRRGTGPAPGAPVGHARDRGCGTGRAGVRRRRWDARRHGVLPGGEAAVPPRRRGAPRGVVIQMVLRHMARVVTIGSVAGVLLALGLSRGLSIFLFGVSPFDPLTFGTAVLALAVAALVASYLPARRATRTDPLVSLRTE